MSIYVLLGGMADYHDCTQFRI